MNAIDNMVKIMTSEASELNEYNDYLQRKLDHYNKWLLDKDRPLDERYPGFPEDVKVARAVARLKEEVAVKKAVKAEKAKVAKAPKPEKAKRAPRTAGPTKQDRAVQLYKELGGVKADVISALQEQLGMSVAGATTYFYNAKKLAS